MNGRTGLRRKAEVKRQKRRTQAAGLASSSSAFLLPPFAFCLPSVLLAQPVLLLADLAVGGRLRVVYEVRDRAERAQVCEGGLEVFARHVPVNPPRHRRVERARLFAPDATP